MNSATERGLLAAQQPSRAGFDVNAAAAGVRAEIAPEPPRRSVPLWTAADYGWDPADANAVAWAAYYSELGVDPDTLAAQQAAEAAAQSATATATAALEPAPEAAVELTAAPAAAREESALSDLSFAPAAETSPGLAPVDAAPDALDGGSAIWELLAGEPPREAALPGPGEELQHGAAGGWVDDGARLDDFQLASGGSFDESTAPLADLGPAGLVTPDDAAGGAFESFSQQLPPLELGLPSASRPAPQTPDLSIDLGFVDDEPAAAVPTPAAERDDAGWAAFAVPAGDTAIDLATFDAEPQLDLDRPPEATAMWGLPVTAAADLPAARSAASPGVVAAFAPPPAPAPAGAPAELGEPLDGSLVLEPLGPGDAAPGDETILEVGEEVVEVAVLPPETAVPPLTTASPDPAPAPAPEPPAAAASSSFVAGEHRVVVHTADGQVKRGSLCDAALDGPELLLLPQSGGAPEPLLADGVKAIFFMMGADEPAPAAVGKKVRVTFRDGRQVAGFSPDYAPERAGFFMVPADTRTHTSRIWVYRASVRQVAVS